MGVGDIRVEAVRKLSADGVTRVAARVDGEDLWFESADEELSAAPEAIASALVPIAVLRERRLEFADPLDRTWLENVTGVLGTWHRWWDSPAELEAVIGARHSPRAERDPGPGTALCFTLGVDSFHTLLRSGRTVDRLITAAGYDFPPGDAPRLAAIRESLAAVERATGTPTAVVRSNLRVHHLSVDRDWGRSHGGALAALGHLHGGEVGTLVISSTKPYFADRPWGSHWDTDPGWSSSRIRIEHLGAELRRNAKLAAIAGEPLVQQHLRVCWENRAPSGNCGRCEKCVRTMLILASIRRLGEFTVFATSGSLRDAVDGVERIEPDSIPVYETTMRSLRGWRLRRAVERLLERSRPVT